MATAPDAAPTERLEDLLTCCVCLKTLNEPKTLPCLHSFCKNCLARYVETHSEEAQKESETDNFFNCPTCRTQFRLGQVESIEGLPSNSFINNRLEILKIQQKAEKLTCETCEAQLPAECKCTECKRNLCGKCLTTHNDWHSFKDHVVLTLEELIKPENQAKAKGKPRCPTHGDVLELYCNKCQKLACKTCIVQDHAKYHHKYQSVHEAAGRHKRTLKTASGIMQDKSIEAQNILQKIKDASQNLKANTEGAKEIILQQEKEILEEFTKKLKLKTAVFLDRVDKKHNEIYQQLSKQHDELKYYVEKVNGPLVLAKNIIVEGSDEEILSAGNEIEDKAKKIEKECPEMMEPVHSGCIEYRAKLTKIIVDNMELNDLGDVACAPPRKITKTHFEDESSKKNANVNPGGGDIVFEDNDVIYGYDNEEEENKEETPGLLRGLWRSFRRNKSPEYSASNVYSSVGRREEKTSKGSRKQDEQHRKRHSKTNNKSAAGKK